eukprot:5393805-Heterocapsa_arctica.AAC.1
MLPDAIACRTIWEGGLHGGLNANYEGNIKSESNRRRRFRLTTIKQAAESATPERANRDFSSTTCTDDSSQIDAPKAVPPIFDYDALFNEHT